MKKILTIALVAIGVTGVLWVAQGWTLRHGGSKVEQFNADCDNLIQALQQYKEFTGSYPVGDNVTVTKSLLGHGTKKVLILAVRRAHMNDKGEIVDPWGVPLQFYFSNDQVLIRSAGPNKAWEDSASPNADDLYRCARMEK